jgi:hypothetical protein
LSGRFSKHVANSKALAAAPIFETQLHRIPINQFSSGADGKAFQTVLIFPAGGAAFETVLIFRLWTHQLTGSTRINPCLTFE